MSNGVKIALISVVALIGLYFLLVFDGAKEANEVAGANPAFVVPASKNVEEEKSKEQLYKERMQEKEGRAVKTESLDDLFGDAPSKEVDPPAAPTDEPAIAPSASVPAKGAGSAGSAPSSKGTPSSKVPASSPKVPAKEQASSKPATTSQPQASYQPTSSGGQTIRSSASSATASGGSNSISACIFGDQTIRKEGNVRLRLLEDATISGEKVPRNTVLTGWARVGTHSVQIEIANLMFNGKLLPIGGKVYSSEGEGIYYTASEARGNLKEGVGGLVGTAVGTATGNNSVGTTLGNVITKSTNQAANEQPVTLPDNFKVSIIIR